MSVFADTSGLLAVLDRDDAGHERAKASWLQLLASGTPLITSNYVIVETVALLQNRLGMEAVRLFEEDVVPVLDIKWVDEAVHHGATSALLAAARRRLSLVDCASFEIMRHHGCKTALTLDAHFREQGFTCLPE
jgi:predicted nucleic acid-binding protein